MFLIPKSSFKKFDPERSCFVLNEFSAAEFASALEMLFAAKNVDDLKLSKGFIRHSLDEYKHFSIFTNIKNQISLEHELNNREIRFIPIHLFAKGYIYKDKFIFAFELILIKFINYIFFGPSINFISILLFISSSASSSSKTCNQKYFACSFLFNCHSTSP